MNQLPKTRRLAREISSEFYLTSKPCARSHYSKRYTSSGACVECALTFAELYRKTEKRKIVKTRHKEANREKYMWWAARQRATENDIPFSITCQDIIIPEYCPMLGVKLKSGTNGDRENSPSLDRIIPSLGYVKGNIMVISTRANVIKNNATTEELGKIYHFLLGLKK